MSFQAFLTRFTPHSSGHSPIRTRVRCKGNALIEYVLPAGIFTVGAAIIATSVDTNAMLGSYFTSGSGDTMSAVQNGSYITKSMGLSATGWQGNGSENFRPQGAPPSTINANKAAVIQNVNQSLENSTLPSNLKQMVYGMAMENAGGAPAASGLSPSSAALLSYASNPANAASLAQNSNVMMTAMLGSQAKELGINVTAATSPAMLKQQLQKAGADANTLAMVDTLASGDPAAISKMAQNKILSSMSPAVSPSDPKAAEMIKAMQSGASMTDLQMMAAGVDQTKTAEAQAQGDANCKNTAQCQAENVRLAKVLTDKMAAAAATTTTTDPATGTATTGTTTDPATGTATTTPTTPTDPLALPASSG